MHCNKILMAQMIAALTALFLVYHYTENYEEYYLKNDEARNLLAAGKADTEDGENDDGQDGELKDASDEARDPQGKTGIDREAWSGQTWVDLRARGKYVVNIPKNKAH